MGGEGQGGGENEVDAGEVAARFRAFVDHTMAGLEGAEVCVNFVCLHVLL